MFHILFKLFFDLLAWFDEVLFRATNLKLFLFINKFFKLFSYKKSDFFFNNIYKIDLYAIYSIFEYKLFAYIGRFQIFKKFKKSNCFKFIRPRKNFLVRD